MPSRTSSRRRGPTPEEGVPAQALAALDRFEEIGRAAVVEAEEGSDRRLEVRRAGGAQQDRVGVRGQAPGLRQADRIGCGHRCAASENQERPIVSGTKGRAFRGATLIRRCRTLLTDGPGLPPTDRRCPISLALCAGAYWRLRLAPLRVRSGGSRVHSLSSSFRLAPTAGSLGRRATGTRPDHSPCLRDGARSMGRPGAGRQALAERVGFEPTESCNSTLFKSAAFNRSATSPACAG